MVKTISGKNTGYAICNCMSCQEARGYSKTVMELAELKIDHSYDLFYFLEKNYDDPIRVILKSTKEELETLRVMAALTNKPNLKLPYVEPK